MKRIVLVINAHNMDWLKAHYHTVFYQAQQGNVKDELFSYFFMKSQRLVVMGSYGRSLLSNFFRRSTAHVLTHTVDLPVFITHH